jgi:O-antigen/teichoic acid export membrane protein
MKAEATLSEVTQPRRAYVLSLVNIGIRGFSFAARLALSLYITRYLGLAEIGRFGIILGAVGFMPSFLGLGLNYFVSRSIIDTAPVTAAQLIRDRLAVTLVMCTGLALACGVAWRCGWLGDIPPIAVVITILEIFALDIHMCLIGLRQAIFAGVLICVRTSSWVLFFIGVSYVDPQFRHLNFAFALWLVALFFNYLLTFLYFARFPWTEVSRIKINFKHILSYIKDGWLVYASDISIAGAMYADRFVVNHVSGLVVTGVYVFFWSIANAVQVLISSSISQVAMPRLVSTFKRDGVSGWRKALINETMKVMMAGIGCSVLAFVCVVMLIPLLHRRELSQYLLLFFVMLLASTIRMVSDIMNYGLYSRGRDRAFASTNIAGFLVSPLLTFFMLSAFGLEGVGVSMLIIAIGLCFVRVFILFRMDSALEVASHYAGR